MAVSVEHLGKRIGRAEILRNVSFSIGDGEVVGLLGPNGAGKSTLMKILTGYWDFQQGRVSVCGISAGEEDEVEDEVEDEDEDEVKVKVKVKVKGEVKGGFHLFDEGAGRSFRLPHEVTRHIGFLPENNPLYEDMYVREYLGFMADCTEQGKSVGLSSVKRREAVEELIERVGLQPMAHKRIRDLSKGYRQRVGIAQALTGDPQLLILDEPTTGLDPNQLDDIRALIRETGRDRTVILSTHILQEVAAVCSRVLILADGQIREDTTDLSNLEELFRRKTLAGDDSGTSDRYR